MASSPLAAQPRRALPAAFHQQLSAPEPTSSTIVFLRPPLKRGKKLSLLYVSRPVGEVNDGPIAARELAEGLREGTPACRVVQEIRAENYVEVASSQRGQAADRRAPVVLLHLFGREDAEGHGGGAEGYAGN